MIKGFIYQGNKYDWEDVLNKKVEIDIPLPIIKAIYEGLEDRKDSISATRLIGCLRKAYLMQVYDVYVEFDHLYAMWRGKVFHGVLEEYGEGEGLIIEKRFHRKIDIDGEEVDISGKMDYVNPKTKEIGDYKTTSSVPWRYPYQHHKLQLEIYKWILEGNGIDVEKGKITYFDMKKVRPLEFKLTGAKEIEEFIRERARALRSAFETGTLPPVKEEFPFDWECKDYCPVRDICWKEWMNQMKEDIIAEYIKQNNGKEKPAKPMPELFAENTEGA